jgi:uncharacterized protein YheU (UPF0270 family)
MSNIKLTVDTLDNFTKSAVINIGKNNGYVEAYIDKTMENSELHIYVYDSKGNVFDTHIIPVALLKRG